MNRDNSKDQEQLLKRIDNMMEELGLIRRAVADLLVAQADCEARAANCEASVMNLEQLYARDFGDQKEAAIQSVKHEFIPPEGFDKEPITMDGLSIERESSESDIALQADEASIENKAETITNVPHESSASDALDELFHEAEPEAPLSDMFVPLDADELLESSFEERLSFDVLSRLSLADRYLYANELFSGDQFAFTEALADIEKLSSWSQVENYLYEVLRLDKDDEMVQELVAIIQDSSK